MISEFHCVVRYKVPTDPARHNARDGDDVCIALNCFDYDQAARIMEGDCGAPFEYFPSMTEAQVRAAYAKDTSPEDWYLE